MTREELLDLARPILSRIGELDADSPAEAVQVLRDLDRRAFEAALRAAHAEGWLTPRENGGVKFGRLAKASPETLGMTIDIVEMSGGAPAPHTHPRGEFDLSFALDGAPRFDGREPGWVVYPPRSRHVPTVAGGTMLIAYFLPGGEILFEPPPGEGARR